MPVLVVEDEALIRMLVCDLLEGAGFPCVAAVDAAGALALLDRGLRPDLLVTDFNLGPGPNGKALAREVARRFPGLPTIFVTGNPECFVDFPMAVWERLVAKPFARLELVAAVGELRSGNRLHPSGTFAPSAADRGFPLIAACGYPVREQFAL